MAGIINYSKRDFISIRNELINYSKSTYGLNFTPSSIDLLLLELVAGVGDMLSFNTDRKFQETQLGYAQERRNLLEHAKTLGLHIPSKKPSITLVEFSVQVPPFGDTFDATYLPILKTGTQVTGGGQVFETTQDVDFSSGYNSIGIPNRTFIPNIDSNNNITSYTIVKLELVTNGISQIFKRVITADQYKPFMEIILPDDDVISIEQIINLDGTDYDTNPTIYEFLTNKNKFYEVPSLVEDKIFLENLGKVSDRSGVISGKYKSISKKFIKEYTETGYCKLIFGGGIPNYENFGNFVNSINLNIPYITNYLNNDALGEIPKIDSTLFIRYRVGGGTVSNLGSNVLTSVGDVEFVINGDREDYNKKVKASLKVNNPIPALGGVDEPSIEQIRRLISYNFAAQNRCVKTRDYLAQIQQMDGRFGAPFRVAGREENNKIVISILALDQNGKLDNTSTNTLKENIGEYLSKYKSTNDYVEVEDGKIINLSFECDLLVDKEFNRSTITYNVINTISSFMDISKHDMNENIYISELIEEINNVAGVLNVIDLRIYNKVGDGYSLNEINQAYLNDTTRQIELIDYTLYGDTNGMFEIRNINKDIIIRTKII